MKVMLKREDASQKVVDSNPGACKDFPSKISVKVYFYYLVGKYALLNVRYFNLLDVLYVYVADAPQIIINKAFKKYRKYCLSMDFSATRQFLVLCTIKRLSQLLVIDCLLSARLCHN